jgi:hypothetical protein
MTSRPSNAEYAAHFEQYVSLVSEQDILDVLKRQLLEFSRYSQAVAPDHEKFRYAPGKWSIRQVYGHLIDGERVFGYRAFCFGRGEKASLASFEENAYVAESRYDERPLSDLLAEFIVVRQANLHFLSWLSDEGWKRHGTAGDNLVSVRALAYIMAGHVRHHFNILRERYGVLPGL